jgi:hypothetical membrane protein
MSWDTFLRLWRWGNAISLAGVLQFLVCVPLAMSWYAGGSPFQEQSDGYEFFANFLSDLGRTVAWSGRENEASAMLFNGSLIVLAVTQVPFYLFFPLHAADKMIPLLCAAALGIISCCGLAGVGLTPYDLHLRSHVVCLLWWIAPLTGALIIHAWSIFSSRECSPLFALFSLGLALLLGTYAIRTAAYGVPPMGEMSELARTIALQKYVILGCVGWYGIFSLRMLVLIQPPDQPSSKSLDEAAAAYVRQLRS